MRIEHSTESANRLMIQTVWPFVLTVVVLLSAMVLSLELMSSVRAYVGGESLWSKGQKQAYISLVNYLRSNAENDYTGFLAAISVPMGDHMARLALEQEAPNLDSAYRGFVDGKNSPDDVPGMIRLYRYFGHTPLMSEPIKIWAHADVYILELLSLGRQMHEKVASGALEEADKLRFIERLNAINLNVTPLEERFSSSIAEVSRRTHHLLTLLLIALTTLLMGLGLMFSRRLAYQRVSSSRALRKESEKNLAFLHNASDGIHILDAAGTIHEVSDSFCNLLRYTRGEVIGMNVSRWDAHFNREQIDAMLREFVQKNIRFHFCPINLQ